MLSNSQVHSPHSCCVWNKVLDVVRKSENNNHKNSFLWWFFRCESELGQAFFPGPLLAKLFYELGKQLLYFVYFGYNKLLLWFLLDLTVLLLMNNLILTIVTFLFRKHAWPRLRAKSTAYLNLFNSSSGTFFLFLSLIFFIFSSLFL